MDVVFQSHPDVVLGSNTFRNCPTILQYGNTPLLEVGRREQAGFETRFSVFHSDGTQIAVVKSTRIFLTKEGEKAKLALRQEQDLIVCELEGKPVLELRRTGAAALKGWAELYAPGGALIKVSDTETFARLSTGKVLVLPGGGQLSESVFDGCRIGILVNPTGLALGVGGGSVSIGRLIT